MLLATGKVDSLKGDLPVKYKAIWPDRDLNPANRRVKEGTIRIGSSAEKPWKEHVLAAGYGPSRLLKHLPEVNLSARLKSFKENALSFEATVQNEAVQSWLLGLFSKRAIAKERRERTSKYSAALGRFEDALRLMCGQNVEFDVDIEPSLQPRLLMYHKRLDFSQLPDGVRSTVGWLADFLMRMDSHDWSPQEERACVLLLDEVDAHLHPKWQRSILPSIKQALPEVQVFATSHSPFVIASCAGARVHVLELDEEGRASNRPAEDAPIGASILATMQDIFGVDSRFDVETEKLLEEWNQLRRSQAAGDRHPLLADRLADLTQDLSSRSEELRQIVSPAVAISDSLIASLQSKVEPASERPSKAKQGSKKG
jgi:predicted ATP-binding protein involved in virulence